MNKLEKKNFFKNPLEQLINIAHAWENPASTIFQLLMVILN